MSTTIGTDQLSKQLMNALTLYHTDVIDGVKKEARKSMKQLVADTKATAPVGRSQRHYRDSIASKTLEENERSITLMWYVKGNDYRLSHLLENGHATRNGGRTRAFHFIKNASDPILEKYVKAVEDVIKNG